MTNPSGADAGSATPATTTTTRPSGSSSLSTDQGRTQIADTVVSKIAGLAAREISGVYALGGGAARAFGAIRERIPGASSNHSQGVGVEVGEKQAAIDLDLVVEYGVGISELAVAIRRNVIGAIERMTGLEVVEVNIVVNDVHIPSDDDNTIDVQPLGPPRVA
ncbi:MAG: Asp23/Gls24 family envelope stress response protein [Pseudonocardia sp.]